jgi:hypothetical protein
VGVARDQWRCKEVFTRWEAAARRQVFEKRTTDAGDRFVKKYMFLRWAWARILSANGWVIREKINQTIVNNAFRAWTAFGRQLQRLRFSSTRCTEITQNRMKARTMMRLKNAIEHRRTFKTKVAKTQARRGAKLFFSGVRALTQATSLRMILDDKHNIVLIRMAFSKWHNEFLQNKFKERIRDLLNAQKRTSLFRSWLRMTGKRRSWQAVCSALALRLKMASKKDVFLIWKKTWLESRAQCCRNESHSLLPQNISKVEKMLSHNSWAVESSDNNYSKALLEVETSAQSQRQQKTHHRDVPQTDEGLGYKHNEKHVPQLA